MLKNDLIGTDFLDLDLVPISFAGGELVSTFF